MPTEKECAWAAGIFEGEGSISAAITKRDGKEYTYLRLAVAMTDRDIVERFAEIMGCGFIFVENRSKTNRKTIYIWRVNSRKETEQALQHIESFFGIRRKAKLAFLRLVTSPVRRKPKRIEYCKRGHPLVGNNRVSNGKNKITCRTCKNDRTRNMRK